MNTATEDIADLLGGIGRTPVDTAPLQIGRLTSYDGLLLEASGLAAPVGTVCRIETASEEAAELLLDKIEQEGYTICGDYICETVAELPVIGSGERGMYLRLQIPIKFDLGNL